MIYLTTAYDFNGFSLILLYGVQLLSWKAISRYILMTVLTKSFYGNILFIIFMNTGCDNFEALILNNITCISVYYSFLYIVYSLMVAYLKAETCKCLFFVTNICCLRWICIGFYWSVGLCGTSKQNMVADPYDSISGDFSGYCTARISLALIHCLLSAKEFVHQSVREWVKSFGYGMLGHQVVNWIDGIRKFWALVNTVTNLQVA